MIIFAKFIKKYLQIGITFFRNQQGTSGVVIDRFDTGNQLFNKERQNSPLFNHLKGNNQRDFYKDLDFTGRIDKNGKPIEDDDDQKSTAISDQIHGDSDENTIDENQ